MTVCDEPLPFRTRQERVDALWAELVRESRDRLEPSSLELVDVVMPIPVVRGLVEGRDRRGRRLRSRRTQRDVFHVEPFR